MLDVDLTDRTVLVTGSAKGVGRALLLATAEAGASVAVHYHTSADAAEETAAVAEECGASATTTVRGDVTDPDEVAAVFDTVETDLGTVDVLVNNVGDFAPAHWADLEFETWDRVVKTNLYGTYLCSKRALPGMRESDWGRIVNVGYAGSEKALANPKNFPYFVAKTGVIMFTRMLGADTRDEPITVNCVSPYVVENSDAFPDELPHGRPATFEDLQRAVLFFLAEGSDYVSGENLEIDGGWIPETL